ncbi:hypothetical protein SASPL_120825 [Salvia splendens]|uniref:Uncharacterized protein n=1 Tax=Salvia splendens TaxID=180675 RepID=A0A8X8XW68_SALSN|nr:hypothetical protein SASPL_120825 [Salvia splendens]
MRRRVHVLRKVPMSAAWLICLFLNPAFFESGAPQSMKKYQDGVTGLGFLFTALSVYVVGQVSGVVSTGLSE